MGGSSKSQTVGYRYYFAVFMGIGRGPIDALRKIVVGGREAWSGNATSTQTFSIDQPNLFGGDEKEGGIVGDFSLAMGDASQTGVPNLNYLGSDQPAYRGMLTALYRGQISANNPYPKPWKFRLRRILSGWENNDPWYPEKAAINVDLETQFDSSTFSESFATWPDGYTINFPSFFSILSTPYGNGLKITNVSAESGTDGIASRAIPEAQYTSISFKGRIDVNAPATIATEADIATIAFSSTSGGSFFVTLSHDSLSLENFGAPSMNGVIVGLVPLETGIWYQFDIQPNWSTGQAAYVITNLSTSAIFASGSVPFSAANFDRLAFGTDVALGELLNDAGTFADVSLSYSTEAVADVLGMNPAHIIYECLTNRTWGRGLAPEKLDEASFIAAADALFAESFGLCLKWTRRDEIQSFIQSILDHIAATLYLSRITGLLTLKLIRSDYDPNDVPIFDSESGLLEVRDASVGFVGKGVNSITVTYHEARTDEDRSVSVGNVAALAAAGGVVNSATKSYPGIPNSRIASRVAKRDLRSVSINLRKYTVILDRRGQDIEPGSVIGIRDTRRGIPLTFVRTGRVLDGTLLDGRITVDSVQDVFALPDTPFAADVPSTWVPPTLRPCIPANQRLVEAPYFMLARSMTPAELDYVNVDGGYFSVLSEKGQAMNVGFQINVRASAATPDDNPPDDAYMCEV